MPRIPTVTDTIQAQSPLASPRSSAAAFGGGTAAALNNLSGALGGLAGTVADHQKRKDDLSAKLALAKFRGDYQERFVGLQGETEEGAPEFTRTVASDFDAQADEVLSSLPKAEQERARLEIQRLRNQFLGKAVTFEASSSAAKLRNDTQSTLSSLLNGIASDPATFDEAMAEASGIFDTLGLPGDVAADMRRDFENQASATKFEASIYAARSEGALNLIEEQLTSDAGQASVDANTFKSLQSKLTGQRKALLQQMRARATSAIDAVSSRMSAGLQIGPAEIARTEQAVKQADDFDTKRKWARMRTTYDAQRAGVRMSPDALRSEVSRLSGETVVRFPGMSREVARAADVAGRSSGIGTDYFVNLVSREAHKDELAGRRKGVCNSKSTACGLHQFIEGTWLETIRKHGERYGIDVNGMSKAELLALRADVDTSTAMAVEFTKSNRASLRRSLGRDPSDAELYMAHFLGAGGASAFIRARGNSPGALAADLFPEAAASNYNVFHTRKGRKLTVAEVYRKTEADFAGDVSSGDFLRLEGMRAAQTAMEKARAPGGPIMEFAADAGVFTLDDLSSEEAIATRGRQALEAARFYSLPDVRPLTETDVESYAARIQTGTVDDKMRVISELKILGPRAAQGAFRQLGDKDGMFAHVAFMSETAPGTAAQVLRGAERIRDNPDVKKVFSTAPGGTPEVFNSVVGRSLNDLAPDQRQLIRQAADALYVERFVGADANFNPRQYEQAVKEVTGGGEIGSVNGERTILPRGVIEDDFEDALDALSAADLRQYSVSGDPPVYADGKPATALDLANEGRFTPVRIGVYSVRMSDGKPLMADLATGRRYAIRLSGDQVAEILGRELADPEAPTPGPGGYAR